MNAVTNNELTQVSQSEIATLPPAARAAVVLKSEKTRAELAELVKQSAGIVAVLNGDAREEAHRAAMTLKGARIAIEKTGKQAREDATAFSKAVIAEEKALVELVEPEERRVLALRDEWDAKIEAEKAAKIAAERARVERIQSDIASIRDTALGVAGQSSAVIGAAIDVLEDIEATEARFEEYSEDAAKVIGDTMDRLVVMLEVAKVAEKAAADAELARIEEAARLAAERAELDKLRAEQAERERVAKIESDRIAAEQAAEAKRLADLAAAQKAEQDRIAAEAQAKLDAQAAQIAEQQRKLAEQQAAADARDAVALAAAQDAQRREDDHGTALEMNAAFDADREAERQRLQSLADRQLADARESANDERKCGLPVGALSPDAMADRLLDAELWPDDSEIVSEIRHMFMREWGMDSEQADARMGRFDYSAAVAAITGEQA